MPSTNLKNLLKKELQFLCVVNSLDATGTKNILIWRLQRIAKPQIEQSVLKLKRNLESGKVDEMEHSRNLSVATENDAAISTETKDNVEKCDEGEERNNESGQQNSERREKIQNEDGDDQYNDEEDGKDNVKKSYDVMKKSNVKKIDDVKENENVREMDNAKQKGNGNDNVKANKNVMQSDNVKQDDNVRPNNNVREADGKNNGDFNEPGNMKEQCDLDVILQRFEMEKELANIKNKQSYAEGARNKISLEMLKELVYVFEGDNKFSNWRTMINNVRKIYNVDDDVMRAVIFNKVKGKALEWVTANPTLMAETVDFLLNEMAKHFEKKGSKLITRKKLQLCTWKRGKRFDEYFQEMVSLGNEIDLDEDELIEYMIAGIPDVNLRNMAKLQNFSTKTEILEAFIDIELQWTSSTQRNAQEQKDAGKTQRRNVKCYNCNSLGHIASECRKPKREMGTCFACGKPGHQAKDCEQYKKRDVQNEYKHS
ncbi:MATH and LRR domain-containing protein PFE0570w-like [Drosophila kikkawai]|uniref:MATH and LRR domain-containing protein PFE0570w-like n=1 Tax=Drosophila kikkawai TaxID=30033 RepID=A0ABM3C4H0_DROKI|nr:uncharacterized protein LOC121501901 [Drosophila kikkawai]